MKSLTKSKNQHQRKVLKRGTATIEVVRYIDGEMSVSVKDTLFTQQWKTIVLTERQAEKLRDLLI